MFFCFFFVFFCVFFGVLQCFKVEGFGVFFAEICLLRLCLRFSGTFQATPLWESRRSARFAPEKPKQELTRMAWLSGFVWLLWFFGGGLLPGFCELLMIFLFLAL